MTLSIGGWDTHGSNFKTLKQQLPEVDRGIANLIQDLHDRGMDNDVVTVMWGEFGRTPKINSSDARPRPLVAGHVGPDRRRRPEDGPGDRHHQRPRRSTRRTGRYTRAAGAQHASTSAIGIDPAQTFPNGSGRPMYILFDPKPEAPEEVRGEMKAIATRSPGLHICEGLPQDRRRSWTA